MPWLEQTPGGAPDESLLAEVARLRQQLDDLNELVDDGVDRLRNAGSDQTLLARQLSDAKDEVTSLQDLLAKMRQNERTSSLEHARAQRAKVALQTDVKELNQVRPSSPRSHRPFPRQRLTLAPALPLQDLDASRRELSDFKRENATLQEDIRGVTRVSLAPQRLPLSGGAMLTEHGLPRRTLRRASATCRTPRSTPSVCSSSWIVRPSSDDTFSGEHSRAQCTDSPPVSAGNRAHADDGSRENVQEMKDLRQARARLEAQVSRADEELRDLKRVSLHPRNGPFAGVRRLTSLTTARPVSVGRARRRAHEDRRPPRRDGLAGRPDRPASAGARFSGRRRARGHPARDRRPAAGPPAHEERRPVARGGDQGLAQAGGVGPAQGQPPRRGREPAGARAAAGGPGEVRVRQLSRPSDRA